MKYQIIKASDLSQLQRDVQEQIDMFDFKPTGGIFDASTAAAKMYAQPMVKE
jgi:hypothetical protein